MKKEMIFIAILSLSFQVMAQNHHKGANVWLGEVSTIWHDFAQLNGELCPQEGPLVLYTNNWGNTACEPIEPDVPGPGAIVEIGDFLVELTQDASIDQFLTASTTWLSIVGTPTGTNLTTTEIAFPNINDGVIEINRDQADIATLDFDSLTAALTGSGTVILNHAGSGAQINTTSLGVLTVGPLQWIMGQGQINANLNNLGTIVSYGPGTSLSLDAGLIGIANSGRIFVESNTHMTIVDGAIFTQTGAGSLQVDGQCSVSSGSLSLGSGYLSGDGIINSNITHSAVVSPGHPVGSLEINGNYQSIVGTLAIEIGGSTTYDSLIVNGTANLTGPLLVIPVNGYIPPVGAQFDVVNASSITVPPTLIVSSGVFTTNNSGGIFTLTVDTPPNTPDLTGDSFVNLLDMLVVINAFTTKRADAEDMNGDGAIGLDDILIVGANWNAAVQQ